MSEKMPEKFNKLKEEEMEKEQKKDGGISRMEIIKISDTAKSLEQYLGNGFFESAIEYNENGKLEKVLYGGHPNPIDSFSVAEMILNSTKNKYYLAVKLGNEKNIFIYVRNGGISIISLEDETLEEFIEYTKNPKAFKITK